MHTSYFHSSREAVYSEVFQRKTTLQDLASARARLSDQKRFFRQIFDGFRRIAEFMSCCAYTDEVLGAVLDSLIPYFSNEKPEIIYAGDRKSVV